MPPKSSALVAVAASWAPALPQASATATIAAAPNSRWAVAPDAAPARGWSVIAVLPVIRASHSARHSPPCLHHCGRTKTPSRGMAGPGTASPSSIELALLMGRALQPCWLDLDPPPRPVRDRDAAILRHQSRPEHPIPPRIVVGVLDRELDVRSSTRDRPHHVQGEDRH